MSGQIDVFDLIGQLYKKVRTEEEKESVFVVLRAFFNYLMPESPAEVTHLFERFLLNFNKLKSEVKNAPQRVEIKASNEMNRNFRNLIIELMLDDQKIKNLGTINEKIVTAPTGFEGAKNEFNNYRTDISRVGHRIIRSSLEKVSMLANENKTEIPVWFYEFLEEENFYGFEPDFSWLYEYIEDSIINIYDKNDEMRAPFEHTKKSFEFLEKKVIGSGLSTLYSRWKEVPHVLIPKHVVVKNPQILLKLYDEAVRTYVSGNYMACIVMCRSLFERILIDYYGAPSKDEEGKGNKLWKIISWSEKRYNSLRDLNLTDKTSKANEIVHKYNGANIDEKTAFSYIKTIKSLIEKIPATNPSRIF